MTLKIKFQIDFFFVVFFVMLMKNFNSQNAYPNIVSGLGTFLTPQGIPITFNMTYTNPFEFGPTLSCIHTLSGFGFQTANLASQTLFTFYTSLNKCQHTMVGLYAAVSDNYLSSIKFYYLVISNEQSMTWVVFLIFPIIDGSTVGPISDANASNPRQQSFSNYYSLGGYYMPENSTTIATYPCLSALQIGTTNLMNFDILSDYRSDITTLQTRISVNNWTYISFITIKVILFNEIQRYTQGYYFTYFGYQNYGTSPNSNSEIMDFNANVTHFDQNYFFTFVGFRGLILDFTNISKLSSNGSTQKHFSMSYNNPTTLRFETNFMQDYGSFQENYVLFYYLVITKYKQTISNNNNNTITQQQQNSDQKSITIILIVVVILSVLVTVIILIVIYKKCHIRKRLIRKSFTLESCQNIRFQM